MSTTVRVQVRPQETLDQLYERLNQEGVSTSMEALKKATGATETDKPLGIGAFEFEIFARESLDGGKEIAENLQNRPETSTADENSAFALHVRNVTQRADKVRGNLYGLDPIKKQHSVFAKPADMDLVGKIGWYGLTPLRLFAQGMNGLAKMITVSMEGKAPLSKATADLAGHVAELDDHGKGAFAPIFRREMQTLRQINAEVDPAAQKWLDRIDSMLDAVPEDKAREGVALVRLQRVTKAACNGSVAGLNDPDLERRAEQTLEMANVPESMVDDARDYIQRELAEHGRASQADPVDPSIYDFNWENPVRYLG